MEHIIWNQAIEAAAKLCADDSLIATAEGYERYSRYSAECASKIRSLARPSQAQERDTTPSSAFDTLRNSGDPDLDPLMQPVSGAVDETEYEGNLKFPKGYCTDPDGVVCAPRGKKGDFDFGYDLGYADGLSNRRNALAALSRAQQAPAIEYTPGKWFKARTIEEMQAFYMSRLPAIRAAAREHGYAIGLHGSTIRDFDLMAMQWRDNASDKDTLAHAISVAACGITCEGAHQWEKKPSGRFAVSTPICWTNQANPDFKNKLSIGHIDLSLIEPAASEGLTTKQAWWAGYRAGKGLPPDISRQAAVAAQPRPAAAPVNEQTKCATCGYKKSHMIHTEFGTHAYVASEQTTQEKTC